MKKIVTALAFAALLLAGCGTDGTETESDRAARLARHARGMEGAAQDFSNLPEEVGRIVSIGASNTEILVGLGLGHRIVAVDAFSADVDGLPAGVPAELDFLSLDAEYVVSLMPDAVFVTGMAMAGGTDDPLAAVSAAGITVLFIPTAGSLRDIKEDILFIADVTGAYGEGLALVAGMEAEIDRVSEMARAILSAMPPRTVYLEIYPAPFMTTMGRGTFLHEMLEIAGASNIFGDMEGWIPVSGEDVVMRDPDVILSTVDFMEGVAEEIAARPGFPAMSAVQGGRIHIINGNRASRPSHLAALALAEIAAAVYPEYFD